MNFDIPMIRASLNELKKYQNEAVSFFYKTLVEASIETKDLLDRLAGGVHEKNAMKFLVQVVDGLQDLPKLNDALQQLSSRHAHKGMNEDHCAMLGKSLLITLQRFHERSQQASWTSQLEDQWIALIGMVADAFMRGARGPTVELRVEEFELATLVRQMARDLVFKALELEMDQAWMRAAKKKASQILMQAIREEAENVQNQLTINKKAG